MGAMGRRPLFRRGLLSVAVACLAAFAFQAAAQEDDQAPEVSPPARPHAGVLLVIRMAKKSFAVGEPVAADLVLTSTGTLPATLPEAFIDHAKIRVRAKGGKDWQNCYTPREVLPGASRPVARTLRAGEEWVIRLSLAGHCDMSTAGSYELTVYYVMPPSIRPDGKPNPIYEGFWEGDLADMVPFSIVVEKPGK